jgi:hypothetical protein
MHVRLYKLDGTLQCDSAPPRDPQIDKAELDSFDIQVGNWERLRKPGMVIAQCQMPTGWCWVYDVEAPSRHSLFLASQANYRVWSFDGPGLSHLLEITGGPEGFPWKALPTLLGGNVLQLDGGGVEPWPWRTRIEIGDHVDPWPWTALAKRIESCEQVGAKAFGSDDPLILFDEPPSSTSAMHLSDLVNMKIRIFTADNPIGDDSFDMGRANIRIGGNGRVEAVWIG